MTAGVVVAEHLAGHDFALHAPHLVDVEVLSALRRLVSSGEATAERAGSDRRLLDLPIERYPHDHLAFWQLRENFSSRSSLPRRWPTSPCRCSRATRTWPVLSPSTATCPCSSPADVYGRRPDADTSGGTQRSSRASPSAAMCASISSAVA